MREISDRSPPDLAGLIERARRFLVDDAYPFWSTTGVYSNGCFVEHLDLAGRPVDPGFTRTRLQARQIYTFSHAALAGHAGARALALKSAEFFAQSAWLGSDLGWAKTITRQGELVDGSADLYDISFALFALAWRYRLEQDARTLQIAHATLDYLDRYMRHPAGGFFNDRAESKPRQQNPHMHLTEAMNAWYEASGEARFLDLALAKLDLFETRFTDSASGALGEYFDDEWRPVPPPQGEIVEPGHLMEWAWIIGHLGRLSGIKRPAMLRRSIDFALRYGYDEATGFTIDQVGRDGCPLLRSRRLWPQTEALKGSLAAGEFLGDWNRGRIAAIARSILDNYLAPAPVRGAWIEHFDASGRPIADKIPASSLYHVNLAFHELLRLEKTLVTDDGDPDHGGRGRPFGNLV